MTTPHAKLNAGTQAGAGKAEEHLAALTRTYGRALRAAGRRAAAQMRRTQPVTAATNPEWTPPPADSLINQEELAADTERKTAKLHRLMLAAAGEAALEPFGLTFDIHAATSQALLDSVAARIQDTITSAIAEQITEAVQTGYAAGKSVQQVSTAILQATDAISRTRADMLARTDLNALSNGGSLLAASASGASATKTWLATEDEVTRETHSDADGQVVLIDQPFDVGGESLQYPGDPSGSWEETANCRCTITYGDPLTASAAAQPHDFAQWRDHAWEGSDTGRPSATAIPSGGTMKDGPQVIRVPKKEFDAMIAAAATVEDEPETTVDPYAEKLAAVREHLAANGCDEFGDDEIRATFMVMEALGVMPMTLEATLTASLSDFTLLAASTDGTPWRATLCVADEPTVDSGIKRLLVQDGGTWRPLPLPLALLDDSPHADLTSKAPICGRIDQISWAGNVCQAAGVFFDASDNADVAEAGAKAAALVDEMGRLGISVDLVDCDVALMVWSGGAISDLDDVNDPVAAEDEGPGGYATDVETADVEIVVITDVEETEYVMAFKAWTIAGATICPVQALTDATISLVASAVERVGEWRTVTDFELPGLTAGAAGLVPLEPPAEWFQDPVLDGPTPLTITDDGRVFGHLAAWDTCHTGRPGCVPPPRSPTGYMNFHLGEIKTAEGTRVAVGTLTFDAPHAPLPLSASQTVRHYDDTSTSGAHVRAGEDAYGIWLAGALNPRISAEEARTLMAAPPSGDWRQVNRGEGIDLVGAHAVNQPGFIVQRKGLSLAAAACEPCDDEFARQLAVLSAAADGLEGLAALAEV